MIQVSNDLINPFCSFTPPKKKGGFKLQMQLNLIQKILTAKASNHDNPLFERPDSSNAVVTRYVDELYQRMMSENRIDALLENKDKKSGVKQYDKVNQRIGLARQKYPLRDRGHLLRAENRPRPPSHIPQERR
jgi:hypothetical protein